MLACGLISAAGCGAGRSAPAGFMLSDLSESSDLAQVSQAVALLADSEIRYLYGAPEGGGATGRPVQLDYYARDLLEWHLHRAGVGTPVVHLGDAVDLSCAQELRVFEAKMKTVNEGGAPWFLVPGSHDGYLHGERDAAREDWNAACGSNMDPANGAMNKADFVEGYLRALVAERDKDGCPFPDLEALGRAISLGGLRDLHCAEQGPKAAARAVSLDGAASGPKPRRAARAVSLDGAASGPKPRRAARASKAGDLAIPDEGCFLPPEGPTSMLRAIAWRVDRAEPWRSFVVQSLRLTVSKLGREATAILLDTSAYEDRPTGRSAFGVNAQATGDLVDEQIEIVHRFATEQAATPRAIVLLFGHHPIESLTKGARRKASEIVDNYRVPLYVSAHTHAGSWRSHDSDGTAWMELNVGSTTDFPSEQRSLQLFTTNERLLVFSRLVRMNEENRDEKAPLLFRCDGAWQAAPGDPEYDDYYLDDAASSSMSAEERQSRRWDALLRSHRRLFRTIRTDLVKNKAPYPDGCEDDDCVVDKILSALRGPSAPLEKARLLADLERFDQGREVENKDCNRSFRLCQATWASQHQALRGRTLEAHDDTVVFPWR